MMIAADADGESRLMTSDQSAHGTRLKIKLQIMV